MARSLAEQFHAATNYTPENIGRHPGLDFGSQPSPFKDWYQARTLLLPGGPRGTTKPAPGRLDLERLGRLLFHTYGVTRVTQAPGATQHFRASPSAGALYPAELYVATHGVAGVPDGLHDYLPREHALALCWEGDFRAEVARYAFGDPAVSRARAVLIVTAVFARSAWRYRDRAYRRILLDSGHLLGNAILASAPDGLAIAPLADFVDDGIDGLLLLDPARESTVLLAAVLEGGDAVPEREPRRSAVRPAAPPPAEGEWIRALHDAARMSADDVPPAGPPSTPWRPAPCGEPVVLDAAPLSGGAVVHEAIRRRRSTRRFTAGPVPLRDAGRILAHALPARTAGATTARAVDVPPALAPALLDTYVVAGAVEGLPAGIYRHDADLGALLPIRRGEPRHALFECCLQQELVRDCAFAVLRTFDLPRAVERFGERAYRYAHLEAGIAGGRLDLAALRLGHGASGIGAFFDDLLVALLGLPHEHAVAYVTTIGVPFGNRRA